jgi:hypothetical protein
MAIPRQESRLKNCGCQSSKSTPERCRSRADKSAPISVEKRSQNSERHARAGALNSADIAHGAYSREPGAESCSALRSTVPRDPNPRASAQELRRDCERFCLPPVLAFAIGPWSPSWPRPQVSLLGLSGFLALRFQRCQSCITEWKTSPGGNFRLQRCCLGSNRPAATSTIVASASTSANSAGSAPVIQTWAPS